MSNLVHEMTGKDVYDHLHAFVRNNRWPVAVWEAILFIGLLAAAGLSLLGVI